VRPPPFYLAHRLLMTREIGRRATRNRLRCLVPSIPSRSGPRAKPPRAHARRSRCSSTFRARSTGLASARSRRMGRGSCWRRFVFPPSPGLGGG
jgi:hypothetical protein